jgi:sugar transferase (PEP-CTERM system associated)
VRLFKHYIPINTIILVISELIIIVVSILLSNMLSDDLSLGNKLNIYGLIIIPTINLLVFYIGDLYRDIYIHKKTEIIAKLTICFIVSFFIFSGLKFVFEDFVMDFKYYILFCVVSTSLIIVIRLMYYKVINIKSLKSNLLIIGYSDIVKKIYEEIKKYNSTYNIVGVLCDNCFIKKEEINNIEIIGNIEDAEEIIKIYNPDILVISLSERRGNFPSQAILKSKLRGKIIEDSTSFYEKITGKILIQNLRPSWIIFADGFSKNNFTAIIKRLADVILAVSGLCISFPLMVIISILIKIDSYGSVFFKQERVGEHGGHFTLVKFRTMVADAEKETGPVWSQTTDPRVTRLGRFLRRTGMDEIPQLFNVLRGDMSFVGPRPERPHFVTELQQKIPYYIQRLTVKPGLTGWAQVRYGYGSTLEDAIEKLQYDLYYIKNMSIFLDFLIILSTIHKVIFAEVAVETTRQNLNDNDEYQGESSVREVYINDQSFAVVAADATEKRVDSPKIYG